MPMRELNIEIPKIEKTALGRAVFFAIQIVEDGLKSAPAKRTEDFSFIFG